MLKIVTLVLAFTTSSAWAGPSDPVPVDRESWRDLRDSFVRNTAANPQIPILFYGDSITSHWASEGGPVFDQYYAPLGVANYGIGGDQIEHIHWRILNGEVEGLSPKLVVLMAGTNNLSEPDNNTEIVRGIVNLVAKLREVIPTAKVLLLGIMPRNGTGRFERIADINAEIARLHNGSTVFFLDMFGAFTESWGTVPEELFSDGLHLTEIGYGKWADTMGPLFNQLVN